MTSIDEKIAAMQGVEADRCAVMPERDIALRLNDYYEVYAPANAARAQAEGERCMNCGAAFCMPDSGYGQGCPIYNKIPEWNELVRLGRWEDAYNRLSVTNPFPEFTSRVCPAPCQDACILGINEQPIQIKGIERAITDRAFEAGWVKPKAPVSRTGKRVAVVGSGPAGLAAAQRLNDMGHSVTVYERSDLPGGLLRYGVPNMKLDKSVLDRRIGLMVESGIRFEVNCSVGVELTTDQLFKAYDGVVLACGALKPRELELPGRSLRGIHQAIPYLTSSMRSLQDDVRPEIDAAGKHVVIIGAGDTGADCIATALRQGALSVTNLARGATPPSERDADHPWPGPRGTVAYDYAHREAAKQGEQDPRWWQTEIRSFIAERNDPDSLGAIEVEDEVSGMVEVKADLAIIAIGFVGHDNDAWVNTLPDASASDASLSTPFVFAGDMAMGPSLVVHAIAEGMRAAKALAAQLH